MSSATKRLRVSTSYSSWLTLYLIDCAIASRPLDWMSFKDKSKSSSGEGISVAGSPASTEVICTQESSQHCTQHTAPVLLPQAQAGSLAASAFGGPSTLRLLWQSLWIRNVKSGCKTNRVISMCSANRTRSSEVHRGLRGHTPGRIRQMQGLHRHHPL